MDGQIRPWQEGTVHVWSEVAVRGTSVFEGLRAFYDNAISTHWMMALSEHRRRLERSCNLLRVPVSADELDNLFDGAWELIETLETSSDLYVRPTVFIREGRYGFDRADTDVGTYCVAFPSERHPAGTLGVSLCVSSWRRSSDQSMPPAIKTGGAYQAFRLPLAEAWERGFDDAILLNDHDAVTETCGASIFLARGGVLITPELSSGVLESITRRHVILLARDMGIPVEEREVRRHELAVADEMFICGTLAEIKPVDRLDSRAMDRGPITQAIASAFNGRVKEMGEHPDWFTISPRARQHRDSKPAT